MATIVVVIGDTTRPKLVIIRIGTSRVITLIFSAAVIFDAMAAKEKKALLPDPFKKEQPTISFSQVIIFCLRMFTKLDPFKTSTIVSAKFKEVPGPREVIILPSIIVLSGKLISAPCKCCSNPG